MTTRPDQAWALVTGASSPIGSAISLALANDGWNVLLAYGSNETAAQDLVQKIEHQTDVKAEKIALALDSVPQVKDAIKAWIAQGKKVHRGPLVGLVANAARNDNALVARSALEAVQQMVDVNLVSVYNCSQLVLRPMIQNSFGRIVFIGSTAGSSGNAGQAAYAMTKSGLEGLAKSIAREYGAKQVTCNVLAPGWVRTPMSEDTLAKANNEILKQVPLGRVGLPEEVAASASFLMSEKAAYITGQTLMVNGGLYM